MIICVYIKTGVWEISSTADSALTCCMFVTKQWTIIISILQRNWIKKCVEPRAPSTQTVWYYPSYWSPVTVRRSAEVWTYYSSQSTKFLSTTCISLPLSLVLYLVVSFFLSLSLFLFFSLPLSLPPSLDKYPSYLKPS